MLKIAENSDPNYLITVVECPESKVHPNADKLEILTIFGNDVIVAKGSYTKGEKLCYFPIECCISGKFLSHFNLYDKPELNKDEKTKGYFHTSGRVKAINLRGTPSQGFLFPSSKIAEYYEIGKHLFNVGDIFDIVGDDVLVTKYIKNTKQAGEANSKKSRVPKWIERTIGVMPRPMRRGAYFLVNSYFNRNSEGMASRIVKGHFNFHYKTEHLGKNVWLIEPGNQITITSKAHGASAIYGMVLCKKTFNILRWAYNKLGGSIKDTEYKFIYASRTVIKGVVSNSE